MKNKNSSIPLAVLSLLIGTYLFGALVAQDEQRTSVVTLLLLWFFSVGFLATGAVGMFAEGRSSTRGVPVGIVDLERDWIYRILWLDRRQEVCSADRHILLLPVGIVDARPVLYADKIADDFKVGDLCRALADVEDKRLIKVWPDPE